MQKRGTVPDAVFNSDVQTRAAFGSLRDKIIKNSAILAVCGASLLPASQAQVPNVRDVVPIKETSNVTGPSLQELSQWQKARKTYTQPTYEDPFPMEYRHIEGLSDYDLTALYTDYPSGERLGAAKTPEGTRLMAERLKLCDRKYELTREGWKVDFFDGNKPKKGPAPGPPPAQVLSDFLGDLFGR